MENVVEVLIADDHELFRRTLRGFIETQTNWHVCGEAGDGVEAVAKAKALRPDVVLMDINMPRMGGLEATRVLRKELPECKVVIVTQNHASIARQQAASVEASASVTKSELTRDLRPTVESVLGSRPAETLEKPSQQPDDSWVPGGGALGKLIREFDWAKTPLGPIENWPQSLKVSVRILLTSRFAMWMSWGPELTFLYNDAYAKMTLGKKHPWALGKPSSVVWKEIWSDIGPRIEKVFKTGEATWDEGLLLFLERSGYREETYHTFSYSPLSNEEGMVCGHLCVVTEETDRIIGERRLNTLRSLSTELSQAKNEAEVISCTSRVLADNPQDMPFTLTYLIGDHGKARLACRTGIAADHPAAPEEIDLAEDDSLWPLGQILHQRDFVLVEDVSWKFQSLPKGAWEQSPERAIILPITSNTQNSPAGMIVIALNPYRPLDVSYAGFLNLVVGQISASISNARAYEEEKKRAEALAEVDRAKTAFFSNVSHEFRTPLTLMLGPLQDLLSRSQTHLTPTAAQQLELVNRNGSRLLRLVNTLLDFSRIEAGRVKAVYQATDLSAFTAELAGVFRSATERAGLNLTVDCQPTDVAFIDRDMWEKIVLNLVSNAFKFTFEGEIAVTLTQVGDAAELQVRDTGVGIPPEEIPHLFDRFHRVPNTRSRTHEGTGIGLALVHELVKIQGGSMRVESTLGRGSTFIVTIPLGQEHLAAKQVAGERTMASTATGADPFVQEALRWLPETEASASEELPFDRELLPVPCPSGSVNANRRRVLVADDNADMRQYLARLLSERYEVVVVADGKLALESIQKQVPDLVVSDIMMPNLDGFGLLQALRSNKETNTIPVILLSARAGEEARVEGIDAGADDYLVKPFSARELLARVQTHLELSRVRKEANELLRENEERLRAFVSASSDVIYRMSPDWDKMYFLDAKDFIADTKNPDGSWLTKYVHPDDREKVLSAIQSSVLTKDPFELEHRVIRPDGSVGWAFSRAIPLLDDEGKVIEWFGAASDITDRKEIEEELREAHAQLEQRVRERTVQLERMQFDIRDLSAKLLRLQDDERRRIARELHDSAGQSLAVLGMSLGHLEQLSQQDLKFSAKVRDAQELLQRVTQEIRTTSYLLHPPLLDESGIPPALQMYIDGLKQRTGLEIKLSIPEDFGRLPKEIELIMFRMVQESLTNVLRHSGAKSCEIQIDRTAQRVTLEIRDDGKGISEEKLAAINEGRSGVGIRGMRDRVRHLNGELHVRSTGAGTTISIALPLQANAPAERDAEPDFTNA